MLYKRSTLAIRDAIDRDLFRIRARMAEFDVVFAQRYFDALNAYFHPDEFPDLNLAWEVAFVGHDNPETTMLQQMLAGLNAHICFDLGVAAATVAPNRLRELKPDFDRITDVVGTQIRGMIGGVRAAVAGVSLGALVIAGAVGDRPGAEEVPSWRLGFSPSTWRCTRNAYGRSASTTCPGPRPSAPGTCTRPGVPGHRFRALVRFLGRGESRDVAGNLHALNRIAEHPADVRPAFR